MAEDLDSVPAQTDTEAAKTQALSSPNAHVISLQLLLSSWLVHFKSARYIKAETMDKIERNSLERIQQVIKKDKETR